MSINISPTIINCAGTGEDGDHQRGVALVTPRFTKNGDGTVIDNQTGLIWLEDSNCMGENYPGFDNDNIVGNGSVLRFLLPALPLDILVVSVPHWK